jgi:hypothetical protein
MTTETNLPATTDESSLPAIPEPAPEAPAPSARPRPQNVTTGLYPLALGLLIIVFVALAFWTLMTTTGGSGL